MKAGFSTYRFSVFLLVVILISACSPRVSETIDAPDLQPASKTITEIMALNSLQGHSVVAIDGRARAQASGPDYSEQGTLTFTSNSNLSFLTIRNSIGVEGGRILADSDSVIVYDRIERYAVKMSVEQSHRRLLNGFTAFNVLDFLIPTLNENEIIEAWETEREWILVDVNEREIIVDRSSGNITAINVSSVESDAFNKFRFSNHARIEGLLLPRRIQILSNDEKSNIFLDIRALEINPSNPSFDINIPDDIPIRRI